MIGRYVNDVMYGASKACIICLTMSFARKVVQYNITANAIAPDPTETEIIEAFSEEQKRHLWEMIPMKRLGKPRNIADVVTFLASEGGDYITGAVINVNGGFFMG